jgi:NAD(P)-dependent dehydrogenase (short-subunit alcohol dehydrogenase family)
MELTTNLAGKVAVVTGAAQGIGEIYAGYLAGLGATVILADLAQDAVKDNAARLEKEGLSAFACRIDIADPEACVALIDGVVEDHGALNILVNNAAVYQGLRATPAEEIPLDVWRRIVDVNVSGMFYMCRAAIPHFKRQRSGVIVNQTSGSIWTAPPGMLHYVTTKSTAIPMTKILAKELGPFGVRVNAIAPGLTDTAATHDVAAQQAIDMSIAATPLGRLAIPEDLCGALGFLCSDDSAFVTGQTIAVNGGSNMIP